MILTNKDEQVCSACGGTDCASFMAILKENRMDAVITKDKQSSIEVSRNAKGQCAFKVKTYYDESETNALDVVDQNKDIMDKLIKEFE